MGRTAYSRKIFLTVGYVSILLSVILIVGCSDVFDLWRVRFAGRIYNGVYIESQDITNDSSEGTLREIATATFVDDEWTVIQGSFDKDTDEDFYILSELPGSGKLELRGFFFLKVDDVQYMLPDWYDFVRTETWRNPSDSLPIDLILIHSDATVEVAEKATNMTIVLPEEISSVIVHVYVASEYNSGDRYWICMRDSE